MLRTIAAHTRRPVWIGLLSLSIAYPVLVTQPAQATAGRIREFVVPTEASHPGGITLGPDGAVWFTEIATNAIGRLQGHTITSFPLPHTGQPTAIVSVPDGGLWFTEYPSDRIGRIM